MGRIHIGAAALVLALGAPLMAQQSPATDAGRQRQAAREKRMAAMLERMDRNHDGAVTIDEWPRPGTAFARLDRDKDGRLSAAEIQTASTPAEFLRGRRAARQALRRLRRMDANGDRVISRDEWKGRAEAFDAIDADKDGTLSAAEVRQAKLRRRRAASGR